MMSRANSRHRRPSIAPDWTPVQVLEAAMLRESCPSREEVSRADGTGEAAFSMLAENRIERLLLRQRIMGQSVLLQLAPIRGETTRDGAARKLLNGMSVGSNCQEYFYNPADRVPCSNLSLTPSW